MEANGHSEQALPAKNLFRIGEVSRLTSTKPFVMRFWETEFPMLQPVKSPKGHRLYRRQDIETVFVIKRLQVYRRGVVTIAGARRHLAAIRPRNLMGRMEIRRGRRDGQAAQPSSLALNRKTLLDLRDSLRSLLTVLESE